MINRFIGVLSARPVIGMISGFVSTLLCSIKIHVIKTLIVLNQSITIEKLLQYFQLSGAIVGLIIAIMSGVLLYFRIKKERIEISIEESREAKETHKVKSK